MMAASAAPSTAQSHKSTGQDGQPASSTAIPAPDITTLATPAPTSITTRSRTLSNNRGNARAVIIEPAPYAPRTTARSLSAPP